MIKHGSSVTFCFILLLTFAITTSNADIVQVDRPRGVPLTKKVLYDSSKDFTCLDGSRTISFVYVNDDYCDCNDGSDEPGTSACPNGMYHCTNAGYRPINIPSSRVNDGLCDCCDGSDEWKNQSICPNNCVELWRIEREEIKKQMDAANQGYIIRQEYSKTGLAKKAERENLLKEYEEKLANVKASEAELQAQKDEIEAKEKEAKDERRAIMEEEQAKKAEEENLQRGANAFAEMDTDRDASLTVSEVLTHTELDTDPSDGDFTEAEARAVLQADNVDLTQFMETVWPNINGTFETTIAPPVEEQEQPQAATEEEEESHDAEEAAFREEEIEKQALKDEELDDDDDEYFEDDDEDFDEEDDDYEGKESPSPPGGEELYYDDATRALIEEADEARNKYQTNQNEKKKIENEIDVLNKALELDFGPDEAFQDMQFQCYEFLTMEYKYKLCPFDKTSQSPKNGGTETSLGRWGSWSGPEGFKHSKMKYENGQGCWNGPSRSTEVRIRCGMEHKLLSVDEPSRCAYVFEFQTPCACAKLGPGNDSLPRDEL